MAVASPSAGQRCECARQRWMEIDGCQPHFNTFYSDRYLTTSRVKSIHNWLAGIPYEHIIILANTDTYGGGGIYNSYTLTTAHHPMFKPVVVHEFGHSFEDWQTNMLIRKPQPAISLRGRTMGTKYHQSRLTLKANGKIWFCPYSHSYPGSNSKAGYIQQRGVYEGAGYTKKAFIARSPNVEWKSMKHLFLPRLPACIERLDKLYTEK